MEDGTPFGRYRLLDLLGRGGMGEVWRAFDTVTERVVALKVLPTALADDEVYQERFRREARSAAALDEPHVVPIHDFGEIDGRLFVTMRLIKGSDLHTILRGGRMDSARAVGIVDQVASALHAAHQVDLVHRDVKPSNILVGENDFAYLIDFGIARAAGQSGLTSASSVVGTWAYMAPERLTTGQTDARADVYALACVLYECLTGSQPFPGDSLEQQIGGHIAMPPPRASERHRDVSAHLDEVIAKGMAKNPDERYSSTRELAFAAKSAVTAPIRLPDSPAPTPPPTTPAPFVNPWAGRQPQPTPPSQPGYVASRPTHAPPPPPPAGPTQYGAPPQPPAGPTQYGVPPGPNPQIPKQSRKGLLIGLSSVAVVAIVAIVAAIVLFKPDSPVPEPVGEPSCSNGAEDPPVCTPPDTGPFTGTFSVAFGPRSKWNGAPTSDKLPGFTDTWRVRSSCGANGCVATASTGGRDFEEKNLTFDSTGKRWVSVFLSKSRCEGKDDERWEVVSLQQRPDGSFVGDWTQTTLLGCFAKRTVTFTKTGDVEESGLPDPTKQPRRVRSPAEALQGRYHEVITVTSANDYDVGVRTDCLRTGDRCMSYFVDLASGSGEPFVFHDEKWFRNDEFDSDCSAGGSSHIKVTAEFPLPQPAQDPITSLEGRGFKESTGSSCSVSGPLTQTFTRTGD